MMSEYKKLNLKEWALEDRPREKLLTNGSRYLSDAELIATLIGSGNTNETAVELSRRILQSVNNDLNILAQKGIDYLKSFNGIGEAKAISIVAALELSNRRQRAELSVRKKITSSSDAAAFFRPVLADLTNEEFWVLLLDRGNKIKKHFKVSQGGISGTVVDVRSILKPAINEEASSIILCHNHPSGTMQASEADIKITKKIRDAAKLVDISVLDHIILAQKNYLSFADEGLLN